MKKILQFTFSFILFASLMYGGKNWGTSAASQNFAPKSITVITPNGGEILQAGRLTNIEWVSDAVANVKIQFTTNNGASWDTVINKTSASAGSYTWEIPNTISTNQAKIRIVDFDDNLVADTSNASFQIVRLAITSPTLNQKIQTGGTKTIQWVASSNVATVKLEYSTNGGISWSTIISNLAATPTSFSWNPIPNTPSATANVRISLSSVPEISDTSDNFLITSLLLTKPNGGENWFAGSFKTITWTSSNVDFINLEYSTNNGSTWNFINSNPISASSESFPWRVASSATAQAKIRISDATVSSINDVSDNVFTISALKITSPNGGEGFAPVSSKNITWTSSSISTINVEYSTDDGNSWIAIQNAVNASLGTLTWNLPGYSFSNGRIRIVSTDDSTNYDVSDNSFKVASVSVVAPNGAEIFQKGTTKRIEWTNSTNVANVTIEVSSNNGSSWIPIAFNTAANTGFYDWTVGNFSSNQALIKISDADNLNIYDQSDAVFIIKRLDLVSPLGGEYFPVDSVKQILWNSSNVTNVKIEYSTDNGSSWTTVTNSTPGAAQSYNWTVPNTPTNFARIRLSDADFPAASITSSSSSAFYISSLSLTSPNGGENFPIGSLQTIQWKNHSSISKVKLEYSTNNGTTWKTIVDSTAASTKSYTWIVPNDPTLYARIRISNASNSTVNDVSDSYFTLGSIRLTSPNGNEKWAVGNTKTITWLNVSTISQVNLDYTTDNGTNWVSIATNVNASAETYSWSIPDTLTPSSLAKIRVSSVTDNQIYDVSDNVFTFAKIRVNSPNGNEKLQVGNQINITWNASNISLVNIQISTDNGLNWSAIANNVSASIGTYAWTISDIPSQLARLRIVDAEVGDVLDQSDATFNILKLDLTAPDGSEGWTIGTTKNITWTSSGISNVKLEYSTNNGSIWQSIAASVTASLGTYAWTIPNEPTSQMLVKISDVATAEIKDSSISTFTVGKITVTEPLTGSFYQAGKVLTTKWTSQGVNNVRIAYTTDNGSNWTTLPGIISAAAGTYNFTIPGSVNSSQARIRVSDAATGQIKDSSGLFTISSLALSSPNGGEYWQAGTTKSITWSSSNITNINLDYSLDNGVNWLPIVSSYPAVSGTYSWALSGSLSSSSVLVKISDASNSVITDQSDNVFKIGTVQISAPIAGDIYLAGSSKQISWTNSSSVTQVKIEYSTDDGTNWNTIVNNYPSTSGNYTWTVPSSLSSSAGRIRISDAGSSLNISSTSGQFSFLALTVTSPNGGEVWQTGANKNITWSASPTIANIKIEYSTNSGQNWFTISPSVNAALGTFAWSIDTSIYSNQMIVRISDVSNSAIRDSSNSLFSIAKLRLLTPLASDYLQGGNTRQISWESSYLSNVKLEYSTNNGGSYTDIIASTPAAALSYSWTIPNNVSSTSTKIRISSATDPTISDSSQPFKVTYVRVLSPNGSENWLAGTSKSITWTAGSDIANVLIQYSTNNGSTWDSITTVTNNGSYSWSVPNSVSTTGRIRITNSANTSLKDSSDNVFTVSNLSITDPIVSSYWQGGTTKTIKWTSSNITNLRADYSTDNGVNWTAITASPVQASLGQLDWSIPSNIFSNQAKVRVYDALDITRIAESPSFKISNLQVSAPNGGENLQSGSTKNVTWSASSNIDSVLIEYSSDNGTNWATLTTAGNSGTYSWTVPSQVTTFGRIRISDKANSSIVDISNNTFTISSYGITSPTAASYWQSESIKPITWSVSNVASVKIEYSTNNGSTWGTVISSISASAGSYNWTLPTSLATNQALIRISDVANPSNLIVSSAFKISNLQVTSPNGGENLQAGSTKNITWTAGANIANVLIEYTSDNGTNWNTIVTTANSGSYSWTVPNTATILGKIRISDNVDASIKDVSDNAFTVSSFGITSPTAASYWQSESTKPISWSISNVANIKIEYSTNNGSTWGTVISSVAASSGTYNWTLPSSLATNQALVRISDVANPTNLVVSSAFKISSVQVTAPNGNENLQAGSTKNITWTAGSNIANVLIEYTSDNGTNWVTLTSTANTGSYSWTVPSTATILGKIRISDAVDATIKDASDNNFTISSYTISSPTAASYWQSETTQPIAWSISNVANVKIEYSTNNGSTWATVISSVSASSGTYNWTLPASLATNQALVRISDVLNSSNSLVSSLFKISNITVTSPNGGEILQSGATKNITWSAGNNIANVFIELSTNNGSTWSSVTTTANTGSYSWLVPSSATDSIKIRISDALNSTIKDESNNLFKIDYLVLTSPIGGEKVKAPNYLYPNFVKWNASSNMSELLVEISTDDGLTWYQKSSGKIMASDGQAPMMFAIPYVSSKVKLRLRSIDGLITSNESGSFTIEMLDLVTPAGNEYWQAGTSKNITWTDTLVSNVKLDYSSDNGTSWNTIIASTPAATGTYSWSIPLTLASSQVKVRVSDASDNTISSTHQNPFVVGDVKVVAPNGGEIVLVGSVDTIKWTASSNISLVRIDYSSDNGATWNLIKNNETASSGQYLWTVSSQTVTPGNAFLVRVSDALSNFTISDVSDNKFAVNGIRLVTPNGGEQYQVGSVQKVEWSASGNITKVRLEYSTDGVTWNNIQTNLTASTGFYNWTIPNIASSSVKVKVSDDLNPSYSDASDANFKIANVVLTSPNGGERWQVGYKKNITWFASSNVSKVNLYYKTSNAGNWIPIDTNITASLNSYSWLLPNAVSQQASIRITDAASNVAIQDSNDAVFTISNIELTSPLGGENWRSGKANLIKWNRSGDVANADLYYSTNNGTVWDTIKTAVTASAGQYSWNVPANLNSSQVKVRIHNSADATISDTSSSFSVFYPSLALVAPDGGEYIQAGSAYQIKWSSALVSKVKIDYYNGTLWQQLTNTQPADSQKFTWTPDTSFSSANAKIRVLDADDNAIGDTSNLSFKVGYVQLTNLNGGENLQANSTQNITWKSSASVSTVKLELSSDNGTSWTTLQAALPSSPATYAWSVPNTPSDLLRLRISDASSANLISYRSSAPFSISNVDLTSPNGGETYQTGKKVTITWNASSNTQNVKLEFFDGTSWNYITDTLASAKTYNWTIPGIVANATTNGRIRISNSLFSNIKDSSAAVFTVKHLEVSSPIAANEWQVNTNQTITWNSVNIQTLKIEYSTNDGGSWIPVTASVSASLNSYSWLIPNTTTSTARIRISDSANTAISTISNQFKIYNPSLTLTSPKGNENWQAGLTKNITWASSLIDFINIEYSLDEGRSWQVLKSNVSASAGKYEWSIWDTLSTNKTRIKISDVRPGPVISDSSSSNFTVTRIKVVSPNGGEIYQAGTTKTIQWEISSHVASVNLEYSSNGGSSWDPIRTGVTASLGQYSWAIPQSYQTTQGKIRVVVANALSISDTSDADFRIGWIAVTSPNGNENFQAGRTYQIAWTKSSSISNVKIEYSVLGDSNYQVIAANEVSTGKYDWTISSDISTNLGRIRISDATAADQISDISDTTFKVSILKITAPLLGSNWGAGSTQTIKWNSSSNIANVRIEYSSNSGLSWDTVTTSVTASDGSYDWKIPSTLISTQAKIRLFSVLNTSISDTSNRFTIFVPSVTLTYPNGGERLSAGDVDTIRWNAEYVASIRIDYSTDNGSNWQVLKDVVDATAGKYAWQIPNGLSTTQGVIRITDVTAATVKDSSSTAFTVGWISITSPDGNENWLAGSQKDIKWNASASVTSVKIEYFDDNAWQLIATDVNASLGKYTWTIPSVPVVAGKIRITDFVASSNIKDTSSGNLTINILTIVSPNGGEFFHAGSTNKITWTKNPIFSNLKLEYSLDNGRNWSVIVSSISASLGEYNWAIPENVSSDSAYLRITDVANDEIRDVSNNPFRIGRLQVLLPSSSIKVLENTVYTIQWSGSDNIPLVDLHYTTDNGKTWVPIANAQAINSTPGKFDWLVPQTPSDSCSIRIRSTSDITFNGTSNSLFTIAQFKLITPNGGQVWQTGTTQDITWQYKYVTNLQIEYTTNNGVEWKSITANTIAASLQKYSWNIPDDINFADVNFKVRIRDVENQSIVDTSNSNFTISYLKLTSPNGGGGQQIGTSYLVRWSHSPNTIKKLKLEYTTDDKNWRYIDTVAADSVQYLWKIPNTPTQSARVRVSDFSQSAVSDASDSLIVISYIALKYPNGGKNQKVQAGKTYSISWEGAFLKGVSIDYSLNGGVDWNPIEDARNINPDSTSFNWTIPNTPSTQCMVRVSDFAYPSIYDVSDTLLSICSIVMTSHNELIAVQNNSVQKITWEAKNIDSVRIQLSLDNGLTWPTSFPVQDAKLQSYDWNVGNQKSVTARLRISDQYDVTINDVNDTNLVIGSYPKVAKLTSIQKDTIKFTYDFSTPGEILDMTKFEYFNETNSPIDVLSSVAFLKNNTPGPVVDTLKWDAKTNLPNFEGFVKVKITLQSNYKISYVIEFDSVGIDNVAPKFDAANISEMQEPASLGWGKTMLYWTAATDSNSSIKYNVAYSTDDTFESDSSITTGNDTIYIPSLRTSTKYNVKFTVSDGLGNSQVFYTQFKTSAAADYNGDNTIDLIDLASFVKAWSSPTSTYGADLAPYTDSIPSIRIIGDSRLNIQDLFVFVDMWNYYQTARSLPKKSAVVSQGIESVERHELRVRKGENSFIHAINLEEKNELVALSAEVHYNPARMRFDSYSIAGVNKKLEDGFTLAHVDSINGVVTINYADLKGNLDNQLQFISTLTSNMDRLSNEDSLVIFINGVDKSLKQTFAKRVVYSVKEVPNSFNMSQNYPNPFNPTTTINYELPAKAKVNLILFDILGRKVATLIDEEQNEGYYQFGFDAAKVAKGLASGVYIYRLSATGVNGNFHATKKMVLLK